MKRWSYLLLMAGFATPVEGQERPTPSPTAETIYYLSTNRGKMGITVSILPQPGTDSIGALVEAVGPGSPAAKAGLRSGDLITRFNGRSVSAMTQETQKSSPGLVLVEMSVGLDVGDTARVEYRRGRDRRNVSMVLEPMANEFTGLFPYEDREMMRVPMPTGTPPRVWYGESLPPKVFVDGPGQATMFLRIRSIADLELAPMNPGLGQYFGTATGVLVISAPERSQLNLRNGDVVMAVDGRKVSSPNQFFRILRSYSTGEEFRFEIVRMKRRETITGTLANR
jgi:S1-C subfamily serine protease